MQPQNSKNVVDTGLRIFGACMRLFKPTVFILICLISISSIKASAENTFGQSSIKMHFGPVQKGEQGLPLADHFIEFLSKSEATIDAAFYEIRDHQIVDAFIAAHRRGVRIRILLDSDHFYLRNHTTLEIDYNDHNPYAKRLLEAGIEVREDEKRSGLMHNKFCVIDQKFIWNGSYNLTTTGTQRNENNALEFQSIKLSRIFTREFNEMFEDRRFGITSPSTPDEQVIDFGGRKIEVYFGPEDNPLEKIVRHVRQARQGVYFMQFAMTANDLGNLLIEQHNAGIKVKGIFDKILYRSTGPYAEFSKLTRNGVPVVVYDSALRGKLHHKVFIIDPFGKNPKVITGSMNASSNGNYSNDENILIIQDPVITQKYYRVFRDLFGRTSTVMASFKTVKPLKANTIVKRLSLMVSSNGVRTQKLNIQFPARWPHQSEDLGLKVYRMRQGKMIDTTSQENLLITSKNMYIRSANLTSGGEGAMLMVRMSNVLTPEIPGMYNMYIKAKAKNQAYYPLKNQPTLEILGKNQKIDWTQTNEGHLLTKLMDGNYRHLERLIRRCREGNGCDDFTGRFLTKSKQILRQNIIVKSDVIASRLLDDLNKLDRNDLVNYRSEQKQLLFQKSLELPKID